MAGRKNSSDRSSNGSLYSKSSESHHGNSRSSTESLFGDSNMTDSQLSDMRLSHYIRTPDESTPYGRTLSFDVNLKERQGSLRMQKSLSDWEKSYVETIVDEGYSMISKAPSQDFEETETTETSSREYIALPQDKVELQSAVEKLKARMSGLLLKYQRSLDAKRYDLLHYEVIVPYVKEAVKQRVGPGMSIGVAEKDSHRVIHIMTLREVPQKVRRDIREAVHDLLGPVFQDKTTLEFARGQLIRSGDSTGEVECKARNAYQYDRLEMGDSIGSYAADGVSTAGPKILLGGLIYRVNCFHMWEKHYANKDIPVEDISNPDVHHPSHRENVVCQHNGPSSFAGVRGVGQIILTSGYDCKTTRVSDHPYFKAKNKTWKSVSDWTVSREKNSPNTPNIVRMTGMPGVEEDIAITSTSWIQRGSFVYSSGRSSGLQIGRVRETPTFMDGEWNNTGQDTWEWTVEQAMTDVGETEWRYGGLGIRGDSGAAVFDLKTHTLCGQVWATSVETGHRVAYISSWSDIAGHITEKHQRNLTPKLPQPVKASKQQSAEPICFECAAERVKYLEDIEAVAGMIRESRPPPPPISDDSSGTYSGAGSPVSEASTQEDQGMSDIEKKLSGSRSSLHRSSAVGQTILQTNADTKAAVNASKKKVTQQIVSKFVEKLPTILDEGFFAEPDSMMPQAAEHVRVAAVA